MGCKTLKIGVFFDGTGNNEYYDSSNGRDQQSNVAKLHQLYKEHDFKREDGTEVTAKAFYIKGIGTYDTQKEHDAHPVKRKYDKGGGGGGAHRIEEAIAKVTKILNNKLYDASDDGGDNLYQVRLIDVFGFSRGSATARDFVNTFIEYNINSKDKYKDVRFNFIGIYDTVGSFGAPGNDEDYKPRKEYLGKQGADEAYLPHGMDLFDDNFGIRDPKENEKLSFPLAYVMDKQEAETKAATFKAQGWDEVVIESKDMGIYKIVGKKEALKVFEPYNFNLRMQSAKKIVHMTAHGEVRKNFPLTNIKGSGGLETSMLGVHSDVGGGYAPEKMERHKFHKTVKPTYFYDANFLIRQEAKEHAKRLNAQGGGEWHVEVAASTYYGKGTYILQKKVLNDLSNVTLNLMYEQAVAHHVDFKPMPQDENHAILPSLKDYYAYAKEHLRDAYTYEQTQDGEHLDATQRHHSSVDPAEKSTHYIGNTTIADKLKRDSADGGGNDARYVDRYGREVDGRKHPELADHVQRAVFNNISTNAIVPGESSSKA